LIVLYRYYDNHLFADSLTDVSLKYLSSPHAIDRSDLRTWVIGFTKARLLSMVFGLATQHALSSL
jgi:hypothetical protein